MRTVLFFLGVLAWTGVLEAAAPWWQSFGPVEVGDFAGGTTDEKAPAELKKLLAQTDFDEWEEYEDEWVRLRYPKHPEIKFKISKGEGGLKVEGGVCTTVDNSFQQAYLLEVGGATYGVILLQPAKWLDDGICFCGPMVHHAYSMRDGCLVRYSLLPGGAVKKAQVLGGGLRLMAFEWTHLACPREIYEKLVDGMSLKLPHPWKEDRLREKIAKDYGIEGKAGWLHPGQTAGEMTALMGEPKSRTDRLISWEAASGDYLAGLQVRLADDRLDRFDGDGVEQVSGPIHGTLSWVEEHAGEEKAASPGQADPFANGFVVPEDGASKEEEVAPVPDASRPRPSPESVATAMKELAPTCHGYRWRTWCDALVSLAKHRDHRDDELVQLLHDRSSARACELEALEIYEHPGLKEWVKRGLSMLAAVDPQAGDRDDPTSESGEWRGVDADALLSWQIEHDEAAALASAVLLLDARRAEWLPVLLDQGELWPAPMATKLALQAVELAREQENPQLVEALFSALGSLKIDDQAAVREAIETLPKGDEGSQWRKDRDEALEGLGREADKEE